MSQDAAEPKPLTCARCKATFKGQRKCPACGYEAIPATAAIPTHEADLQEITRAAKNDNRAATWEEKQAFMAGIKAFALEHGYKSGWAAQKYRTRFACGPTEARD